MVHLRACQPRHFVALGLLLTICLPCLTLTTSVQAQATEWLRFQREIDRLQVQANAINTLFATFHKTQLWRLSKHVTI